MNIKNKKRVAVGIFLAFLVTAIWFFINQLTKPFLDLLQFNARIYAKEAIKLPNYKDLARLAWVIGFQLLVTKTNRFKLAVANIAGYLPAVPRFELHHIVLIPVNLENFQLKSQKLTILYLLVGAFIVIKTTHRDLEPNFYYQPLIYKQAEFIKSFNTKSIYFWGGPDQLYYLTDSLPPDNFYLPSLPWYHHNTVWVDRQIEALKKHPESLVVINEDSRVDNVSLLNYNQRLYQHITSNYQKIGRLDSLQVYSRSHMVAKK